MGGAVALKVHLKQPNAWDGAVLLSPMCKDTYNVLAYRDNPHLKTAIELLNTAQELEHRLKEARPALFFVLLVSVSIGILHDIK
ncbi:hypothetical protein IFM89_039116 [Coptis chinensis]|uniref:Uncharacterized protein n=1 Tax=Coptis chinensis TaxID=261450 RepID=A0A835IKB7_9MAGN|nr:hypothetical protein IFM89_039116 [Coptis chinensis]